MRPTLHHWHLRTTCVPQTQHSNAEKEKKRERKNKQETEAVGKFNSTGCVCGVFARWHGTHRQSQFGLKFGQERAGLLAKTLRDLNENPAFSLSVWASAYRSH